MLTKATLQSSMQISELMDVNNRSPTKCKAFTTCELQKQQICAHMVRALSHHNSCISAINFESKLAFLLKPEGKLQTCLQDK